MESPSISKRIRGSRGGFTLIEILIAFAIMTVLISFALSLGPDVYRGYIFRSERSIVLSVLEKARSQALTNYQQSPWGFCYDSGTHTYLLFKGKTCIPGAPTNEPVSANSAISDNALTTFPTAIVFSQLTGTTTGGTIHITDGIKTADITINNEGRIDW